MRILRPDRWLAALTAVLLPLSAARGAGLAEDWYLFRARSNMQIKNYKAAIEAYQKAIEKNPKSREALKGLGDAYQANGQTDESIAAYDRYLAAYPDDADIAFKQAQVLGWSRYQYRRKDAIRYYRMGLARRDDPAKRLALARLLARDKATLDEALQEYRKLLEQRPDDATLRAQYRKLLAWDPRYVKEAIREQERVVREKPDDREASLQLARLYAQDPSRLADSADRYRILVEASPSDRRLRLEYARVLARIPARREEAREQIERGMGANPDYATRKLYASLLAADDSSREEALDAHRSLLEEKPDDVDVRIAYGRLLAARKETSGAAIREFESARRQRPDDVEIHEGLARAYAWAGDEDRALVHARRARELKTDEPDVEELGEHLEEGREPRLGGGLSVLVQPAGDYGLFGLRVPAQARVELGTRITISAEGGFEHYRGPSGVNASGAFFGLLGEARFTRDSKMRLGFGLQTVRPDDAKINALAEVEARFGPVGVRPRFERQPRTDSFRALVDAAATSNTGSLLVERHWSSWTLGVAPFVSVITATGADANVQVGIDSTAGLELIASPPWHVSAALAAHVSHYGSDELPLTRGGYFSPDLHATATPRLSLRYDISRGRFLEAAGGPSLQYQLFHGGAGSVVPGGQARARAVFALARELETDLSASFDRVGNVYARFLIAGSLLYVF